MNKPASVFEETISHYREQLAKTDYIARARLLGIAVEKDRVLVPLLGEIHRVSPTGIFDPEGKEPLHALQVVLYRYLLLAPTEEPTGEDWVSYRDFKDAAPFVGGFVNNTEKALARHFARQAEALREASAKIGGYRPELELSYQVVFCFNMLPQIPLLLLFNEEDEEFPAQCLLLFQRKAEGFLDMECLAILGWHLTDTLILASGDFYRTIM